LKNPSSCSSSEFFGFLSDEISLKLLSSLVSSLPLEGLLSGIVFKIHESIFRKQQRWILPLELEKQRRNLTGLELLKPRSEGVKAFCVNRYQDNNNEVVLLDAKDFKSFFITTQLYQRTRSQDGLTLHEEVL